MPIGGVVVSVHPADVDAARSMFAAHAGVEVHGADARGNLVVVLETRTGEEMEALMRTINAHPLVLHAGLTYLNMEDLIEPEEGGAA